MTNKPAKEQAFSLHIGYDTEFNTPPSGIQEPVSSQFFLYGYKLTGKTTVKKLKALAKRWGLKLLHVRVFEHGLGLVFDSRDYDAGEEYRKHFGVMVSFLLEKVCKISSDTQYELHLWTLYSNAEIANLFPTRTDLSDSMREQGDTEKRSSRNMTPMPIQKTFFLGNYRQGLPKNVKATIRDVRHLFFKPSLEALGKQIGIEKLEHPDWDKVSAGEWLESDPVAFCEYGVMDAMIPCMAAVNFHKQRDAFIYKLISKDIVSYDLVEKLLNSISVTAAGISDRLVKAYWQHKGVWGSYEETVEILEEHWLSSAAQRTKGGLNKFFLSDRPQHLKGVDVFDVKSQYANAMMMMRIPLGQPETLTFSREVLTAKEVASILVKEKVKQSYLHLDWELPENATEWERSVVAYDRDGDGCTLRKADNQWILIYELLLMAHITPNARIKVHQCMVWRNLEIENRDYASCREFMGSVNELRKEYKDIWIASGKTDISADTMQNTIKLIGNGTAGKFGQHKAGLDMNDTHETLMKGGDVSNTANGSMFRANITFSLAFNIITSMARSFTAYSAWLNKADMVVTDSMVIKHGTFKNPAEHLTEYPLLNAVLTGFEFEQEESNAQILIFKERDYAIFKVEPKAESSLEDSLEQGMCVVERSEYHVLKVAKRGWRPRPVTDDEVETFKGEILKQNPNFKLPSGCNDWKTYISNVEFFENGFSRLNGLPLTFQKTLLLGAKEFLLGCGILNSRQTTEASIGSHNLRYMCDDVLEFKRRKLVKQKCRSEGYADALHCELKDPERFAMIVKRCKPKPQVCDKLPHHIRKALGILAARKVSQLSQRQLAAKFGISKSLVNRLALEVKASKLDLRMYKTKELLAQLEQWFEGLGVPLSL